MPTNKPEWELVIKYRNNKIIRELYFDLEEPIRKAYGILQNFNVEDMIFKGIYRLTYTPLYNKWVVKRYNIKVKEFNIDIVIRYLPPGNLNINYFNYYIKKGTI